MRLTDKEAKFMCIQSDTPRPENIIITKTENLMHILIFRFCILFRLS